jgi:prepilin-type N-terminal cleavage/methylation domain-containing protein
MHSFLDKSSATAGFSLVEILVVIGIILMLTAIAVPVIATVRNSVRNTQTTSQVQGLYAGCEVYAMEDRRRMPPPMEADLSLRTSLNTSLAPRTLDLLRDRGVMWESAQLGPDEATGRALLDAWHRPIRYQPDVNMDGVFDKPAPQADWNAKSNEPFPYVWSLGKPSGAGDIADADPAKADHWIYVKTSP